MAAPQTSPLSIYQETLVNYLVSMARTVERSVHNAMDALTRGPAPATAELASEVFLLEPRVNEMEMLIDEHAVRILRAGNLKDEEIRLTVAALKITNDLERMGDLAVNLAERVISLQEMPGAEIPPELQPMVIAVRAMVTKCLGALTHRNLDLATEVLEADDVVDRYRDQIFERLMEGMTADPAHISPNLQFVLASRYLERIADHATNIAEDTIFWLRGLDVRHGRALALRATVTQNSQWVDSTLNSPL
jgi:phosphate transport system protein